MDAAHLFSGHSILFVLLRGKEQDLLCQATLVLSISQEPSSYAPGLPEQFGRIVGVLRRAD